MAFIRTPPSAPSDCDAEIQSRNLSAQASRHTGAVRPGDEAWLDENQWQLALPPRWDDGSFGWWAQLR